MSLFDFLKIVVGAKKPTKHSKNTKHGKPAARPSASAVSVVEFDGKSFPIAALTTKGFATTSFDGSLIQGQNARVSVRVDDAAGKFTFAATIAVTDTQNGRLVGAWTVLPTEVEDVIRKYSQLRKQKAGK